MMKCVEYLKMRFLHFNIQPEILIPPVKLDSYENRTAYKEFYA